MYREMRRMKQQLSEEKCLELLKECPRGVLSVYGENGYPYGMPMNFYYNEQNHKLYFHGAKQGHKVEALKQNDKVSFCVYDQGYRKEGEWALNIQSVILFGRIRFVENEQQAIEAIRQIGLKYHPDREAVEVIIERSAARTQVLEMTIDHMTGKLVKES